MSKLRQIALVLGMHRSGTSALAALVSRLGFDIGKNVLPANEFNEQGYYENERIVRFHTEALEHLGSSWHDLRVLSDKLFRPRWLDDAALKLSNILQTEFGRAKSIVVKDPRACRLLPIWQRLALEKGVGLRCLLIGRHPLEVCYSLNHRDGFSRRKSLLLWLQHNLAAERHSRSFPRYILRYRDLMAEPKAKAKEIASFLDVKGDDRFHDAAGAMDGSLAHHQAEPELLCDHPELSRWTKSVWITLFQHRTVTPTAQKRLDGIFRDLTKSLSIFPEEAVGKGDYDSAAFKRMLSRTEQEHRALKERYQEQNQSLQNVMGQRDEWRKRLKVAQAEKDRLVRENSALSSKDKLHAELLRKEERKVAEAQRRLTEFDVASDRLTNEVERLQSSVRELERELVRRTSEINAANDAANKLLAEKAELERELQKQRENEEVSQKASVRKIEELDSVRLELGKQLTDVQNELQASREKVERLRQAEVSLHTTLAARRREVDIARNETNRAEASAKLFEEQRRTLQQAFARVEAQNLHRNASVEALRNQLERLRHQWTAFLVRRRLKQLASSPVADSTELIHLNGQTPSVWNSITAGFNFGLSVFPDVRNPERFFIEGWVISKEHRDLKPTLRLVSESGLKYNAKCGRERIDIPLLFPDEPQAARCGFAFLELGGVGAQLCRLELRKSPGEWVPLALVDFFAMGWRHLFDISEILASRLFDAMWYAQNYGLSDLDRAALVSHYLREGAARGLFPNPLFDTAYYLETNRDIRATGENPLLSYLQAAKDGKPRQPNQWFDPVWYLAKNNDVADAAMDPFVHYLDHGRAEGRNPGPRFDVAAYLDNNPDVEQDKSIDALSHYLHYGRAEGRQVPDPLAVRWVHRTEAPASGKANVLLVGHVLGKNLFGGERSLLELIRLIDRSRFNIFCSFPANYRPFIKSIKPFVAGVAVFPYQWWDAEAPDTDGFDGQFEEILRSCRIGLVHVNSIMLRDPLIAAKKLGIPSILHLREIVALDRPLAEHIGLPAKQIVEEVSRHSDFSIANSHFTQAQYKNQERSFVLYNTADEVGYDMPLRRRDGELRVAMISSNIPKKGLEDFFAMARLALKQGFPIEFWLVGPETEWLKRHVQSEGTRPTNVRLVGYVEQPHVVLREVDVVVNLSHFAESFGRTVAEGMLARRPAVVYDYGALPELIRDGVDGFVVPFRDVDAVVQRLHGLAQDSNLLAQMAESARARALCNFSRRVGAKTLNDIYEKILKKSGEKSERPARAPQDEPLSATSGRKMRIGYFLWHFPVPSETFVLNELRYFVKAGYDVRVFCCQSPNKDFKPDFPIEWEQVKSPEELALRIQETECEIMHSHFVFPTVTQYLWPACESARVPFTFIAHGQDVFRHTSAAENRIGEIARSPFCRNVFAPGTFHRDLFLASGVPEEKIIVNPQTILFHAYEAQPIASRLRRPKMSVCAIHRFVEKKGLSNAIRAAAELAPRGVSLHLYGYGPLEQSYRDLVAELGLDNVFFGGPVTDREHMAAVFREHDLFVCPSIRANDGDMDGIPTILLEAMASHVPVVASRVSSIPDLIRDGVTGYLCEPGDADSLTRAILRFYGDSTARVQAIVENAREIVGRRFDIAKASRTLLRSWSGEGLDVVLVTFNATAEVREVITRLYRYTKTPFRLYLVDNGSAEDTLDYLHSVTAEHDNAQLLQQGKNLFVGPGFNKGLEAGNSPFAVYLCSREGYVLSEGWDQSLLNYMEGHPAVGLAGTLCYSPAYLTGADYIAKLEPFSRFRDPGFAAQNPDRLFQHVQGGMFVVRRSMYEAIGGFSETVPHNHTDVEYSYYVESCGWELGHIPEVLSLYNKTRPDLTARLTESVGAVHPGSPTLTPLLESVVRVEKNLCNVCGSVVVFEMNETSDYICPVCAADSFHRSLYRFLAESTLTYRRLLSLFAGEFECLLPKWKEMFGGRAVDYSQLLSEIKEDGRIDHRSAQLNVIALSVPDAILNVPRAVLTECCRILKPGGTLLYFQRYGKDSIFDGSSERTGIAQPNADSIAAQLAEAGLRIDSRIRYASAALRYSEHVIFLCGNSSSP